MYGRQSGQNRCELTEDIPQAIECKSEPSLLETVGITAQRLQHIESRLQRLNEVLHGESKFDDLAKQGTSNEPSVRYCAQEAFSTSARIECLVDEIIQRTEC